MKLPLLTFDSCTAGHLLFPKPKADEIELWRRVQQLRALGDAVRWALPAPVVGELLAAVPKALRPKTQRAIEEGFDVLSFDYEAALVAAELWAAVVQDIRGKRNPKPRPCLKLDTEIVACAIRHGVMGLCSVDTKVATTASRVKHGVKVGEPEVFLVGVTVDLERLIVPE